MYAPAERADTLPLFLLYPYMYIVYSVCIRRFGVSRDSDTFSMFVPYIPSSPVSLCRLISSSPLPSLLFCPDKLDAYQSGCLGAYQLNIKQVKGYGMREEGWGGMQLEKEERRGQRHILRDRRPSTAACPACWAIGTKELR